MGRIPGRTDARMCTFITVFLPASLRTTKPPRSCSRSGRRLLRRIRPACRRRSRQLAAVAECRALRLRHVAGLDAGAAEWKGDAERWRKKGWSEAKIARALSEQLARHEQDQQVCRDEALAGQWLQRIDALLGVGAARIGLLVRVYDGSVGPGSRSRRNIMVAGSARRGGSAGVRARRCTGSNAGESAIHAWRGSTVESSPCSAGFQSSSWSMNA
jgi:hypothetical protein